MDIPDSAIGKLTLTSVVTVFLIVVFWINTYPFIEKDNRLYDIIPNPHWFLLFCASSGALFIGGLMVFTLYHLYPYL